MKNPLHSFGFRVTLAIIASMVTIVFIGNIALYQLTVKSQLEDLRFYLKSIANTSAGMINPEDLAKIPLSQEGEKTPAYNLISEQLKKIKAANPRIEYIYILTRTSGGNVWRFSVDVDVVQPNGTTQQGAMPGSVYDAGRFSQMLKGFDGPSADLKLEKDEWGTTLSGYAPIRDSVGKPMAVLGVDVDAKNIYAMEHEVCKRSLLLFIMGVIFAVILGTAISRRVVGPLKQLKAGIEYINEGHWHYQVRIVGDDEIAQLAKAFNNMASGLYESRQKLLNYFFDSVKSMVVLLEARDHYTLGHSEAVAYYSEQIAMKMGMDPKRIQYFRRVVLLHDIGKVGVRDNVLLKTERLDDKEWESIKLHPVLGEQILKPILSDPEMLAIVRNHHERYDGKGYPDGLIKEKIPLLVAIVTAADSYDAMTSNRPYRKAMTKEEAMEELINH